MVYRRWAGGGTLHESGLYSSGVGSTTGGCWGFVGLEGSGSQSQEHCQGLHPGRRGVFFFFDFSWFFWLIFSCFLPFFFLRFFSFFCFLDLFFHAFLFIFVFLVISHSGRSKVTRVTVGRDTRGGTNQVKKICTSKNLKSGHESAGKTSASTGKIKKVKRKKA